MGDAIPGLMVLDSMRNQTEQVSKQSFSVASASTPGYRILTDLSSCSYCECLTILHICIYTHVYTLIDTYLYFHKYILVNIFEFYINI